MLYEKQTKKYLSIVTDMTVTLIWEKFEYSQNIENVSYYTISDFNYVIKWVGQDKKFLAYKK